MKHLFVLVAILLCACAPSSNKPNWQLPATFTAPTKTATMPMPALMATPTVSPTPCQPMQRALGDTNMFPEGSGEWQAWERYDAILKKMDAERKTAGDCKGLTADEQMLVWQNALRKFGVIE
jgi:hypothetical protein